MIKTFKDITLLWALRSPCNLDCVYCYYGCSDDKLEEKSQASYELNHSGKTDIEFDKILHFASIIDSKIVKRIFITGGEPLNYSETLKLIEILKNKGCEVVVCTNGLALTNEKINNFLIDIDIDAISVSLDTTNYVVNDKWRRDYSGRGGKEVMKGLHEAINNRNKKGSKTKIGVYSVITKETILEIIKTFSDLSKMNIDYFIFQPVSLNNSSVIFHSIC